jgi:hypothetical protein
VIEFPRDEALGEDIAVEVGGDDACAGTEDFDAGGDEGLGIEAESEGLAADAGGAIAGGFTDEAGFDHAFDDEGDGAGGEAGDADDIGPGEVRVLTDHVEEEAFIGFAEVGLEQGAAAGQLVFHHGAGANIT